MSTIDHISGTVAHLIKKCGTRDPVDICGQLHIRVCYKELGAIKAFYFYQSRIKTVVINSRISRTVGRILCAHELGHAVLHGDLATMRGFQEMELFDSVASTEYEANLFAAELLIDDERLLALLNDGNHSFFSVAKELHVPVELIDFKFRVLKHKGYRLEPPYPARADFFKKTIPGCGSDDGDGVLN